MTYTAFKHGHSSFLSFDLYNHYLLLFSDILLNTRQWVYPSSRGSSCSPVLQRTAQLTRCCSALHGFLIPAPCAAAPLTFLCMGYLRNYRKRESYPSWPHNILSHISYQSIYQLKASHGALFDFEMGT